MYTHPAFPFSYDDLDVCDGYGEFYGVVWQDDFGPWKAGQSCENIRISVDSNTIREYIPGISDIQESCKYTVSPKG